jgi:choline dehydrogenase-like flavoprotein
MPDESFDVIIIGTGAGGGTLAQRLAPSGARILILERGGYLPREKANWSSVEVFQNQRYHTTEMWRDKDGKEFRPGTGYNVGGNTKVYGAAMFRFRERDFERIEHKGGISPEWPLKYRDFERYYTEAEALYEVHGQRGSDPTEPPANSAYPFPPVSHEPRIQKLFDDLTAAGRSPFPCPLAIKLDEIDRHRSACIRCNTCDGFPCLVDGKGDSDVNGIRPALTFPKVTLRTNSKVTRLLTERHAAEISGVEVEVDGEKRIFRANLVVVSAGAINSAAILLRSASDKHPNGLANASDQVGRNYMRHQNGAMLGISTTPNPTEFQKTFAMNDFYWGSKDFPWPMGHIQLLGKADRSMLEADIPLVPGVALQQVATHSIDWWLTAEDLPSADNRVLVNREGQIELHVTDTYHEHFDRLVETWKHILKQVDDKTHVVPTSLHVHKNVPLKGVAHQCGTCRFGEDPASSVLDLNCRAHEVDNLYVVDGSFFCSAGAVNPSLTIAANALRVGDHLLERLGKSPQPSVAK